jgi:hypothetical protein
MPSRLKQALSALILVAGLAFCIVALARLQRQFPLHWAFTGAGILEAAACATVAMAATAFAWRRYMTAFLDTHLSLRDALYQIGVMQIGKYVPVVIGGFVARISANTANLSAGRIVVATIVEQLGAMGAALLIGICCYVVVAVPKAAPFAIAFVVLVVWLAPWMLEIASRLFVRLRGAFGLASWTPAGHPDPGLVRQALTFQLLQMIAMAGFIGASIALVAPDIAFPAVSAVTGAYLVSIVIGIAVVFVPGGIGIREAAFVWLAATQIDSREALQLALALRIAMSALDLVSGAICLAIRLTVAPAERRTS